MRNHSSEQKNFETCKKVQAAKQMYINGKSLKEVAGWYGCSIQHLRIVFKSKEYEI